MTAAPRRWAADLLHFWFHELGPEDWFGGSAEVDAASQRFARDLDMLGCRPPHEFLGDPLTSRAAILLFDQIPRNAFRKDARAFAHDALARRIAKGVIARGWLDGLSRDERAFVGMPLMHSEAIADQRASLAFFRGSPTTSPSPARTGG